MGTVPPDIKVLTVDERIGLAFVVEAAALSMVAPLGLIVYLIYTGAKNRGKIEDPQVPQTLQPSYFRSHLHYYFISLLFADAIQGLGGVMDAKWVSIGAVTGGQYCAIQGVLEQVGDVGVALSILAITIHTFFVLFFHWVPPTSPRWAIVALASMWLLVILLVSIASGIHGSREYYSETGLWCWISKKYPVERIALEYAWMWSAALVNILLYIPLFFSLRGNILVSQTQHVVGCLPRIRIRSTKSHLQWLPPRDEKHYSRTARVMLCYPLIYLISILPTSVARFMSFGGHDVSSRATLACAVFFSSSGIFNVILFLTTRPAFRPLKAPLQSISTAVSFHRTRTVYDDGGVERGDSNVSPITRVETIQTDVEMYQWRKSNGITDEASGHTTCD